MSTQIIHTVLNEELTTLLPNSIDLWPTVASKWTTRQQQVRHRTSRRDMAWIYSHRLVRMRALTWALLAVIVIIGTVFTIPQWRTVAAKALVDFWQVTGIAVDIEERTNFSETPPFNIYQPSQLPAGFVLKIAQGYSGTASESGSGHMLTSETVRQDNVDMPSSSAINERVEAYQSALPHALFVYQASAEKYMLLYERAAQLGEQLPPGSGRTINGNPATLEQNGNSLLLTWVQDGTWLSLEGTVNEITLLETAHNLQHQVSKEVASGDEMAVRAVTGPPFCNPTDEPPAGLLLGNLTGQQHQGDIYITFMDNEYQPERVAVGISQLELRKELIQRAITVLDNPNLAMELLPYPSFGQYVSSGEESCLSPDPEVQGYIVIEVWENQINVGYGGEADQYMDRAIKALERTLNTN